MLPAVFGLLSPLLPVPLTIILTAVVTYCLSYVISRLIGKLPFGKYIVGWKGYSRSWLIKYASRIARSLVALQDDGMEVFDLWVQRISSSETLCFEDEISMLPVSSSKKGLNEDETGSGRLFPDAKYYLLSKGCRRVLMGYDYQWVTRLICHNCDRIGVFCDNHCDRIRPNLEESTLRRLKILG